MHLIAAHSRFCAIEQARAIGLRAPEWTFVTSEWVIKGRIRQAERLGTTETLITARCWRPTEHETAAVADWMDAGHHQRTTHCGGAR